MFKHSLLLVCIMSISSIAQAIEIRNYTQSPITVQVNPDHDEVNMVLPVDHSCSYPQYRIVELLIDNVSYVVGSVREYFCIEVRKNDQGQVMLTYTPGLIKGWPTQQS